MYLQFNALCVLESTISVIHFLGIFIYIFMQSDFRGMKSHIFQNVLMIKVKLYSCFTDMTHTTMTKEHTERNAVMVKNTDMPRNTGKVTISTNVHCTLSNAQLKCHINISPGLFKNRYSTSSGATWAPNRKNIRDPILETIRP